MSNQAKRLSNCPADRLAQCRGGDIPPAGDGVDFGIDDRSVRVSQEAYSIFLAREQMGKDRVAALQQRLNIADQRVCDQQTELTKARNLISTLDARLLHKDQGIDFRDALISEASELAYKELPATWLSRASTLCVRQSAPAARVCNHIWAAEKNAKQH